MIEIVKRAAMLSALLPALLLTNAFAEEAGSGGVMLEELNAREAVREGNRLLLEGDASGALKAYEHATGLEPDAREIPFVQGLAHFTLNEHEQARQAFETAATTTRAAPSSESDQLTDDATYSLGTTYHAEALASLDNPELAISSFESAMQRYQSVLTSSPEHKAAREANLKAATMWRQLKQLLEEQQQQQQSQDNSEQDQQQQQNENDEKQSEQQQSSQDQQESENEQEQQQQQADADQSQNEKQQEQAQPQQEDQALREQAQRRLREMMQALRERKKAREEYEVVQVPAAKVDKDW